MRFYFVTYLICLLIVLILFFALTISFKEGYIIVKWLNWKGCHKHNVYGADCNVPCPRNCKNNTCHIHNGTCLECNPGWKGPFCSNSTIKAIFKLWPYDDQKIFFLNLQIIQTKYTWMIIFYVISVLKNVLMGGTDKTAWIHVLATVNIIMCVITWLVSVKEDATLDGQGLFAKKVI